MCEESSNKLESGADRRKRRSSRGEKSRARPVENGKKVDIMPEEKSTPGLRREKFFYFPLGHEIALTPQPYIPPHPDFHHNTFVIIP